MPAAELSTMRLRCPGELEARRAGRAVAAHEHLAMDVRLPLSVDALGIVLGALTATETCPCGRRIVIAPEAPTLEEPS